MANEKVGKKDKLGWLLGLPVVLIWLDAGGRALHWRLSSVSEAALMLQSGAPLHFGEGKENA
jgi:hypothetical protein